MFPTPQTPAEMRDRAGQRDAGQRYAAVLGRIPFHESASPEAPGVAVYGFAPLKSGLWRRLMSEAHDAFVYLTAGLSGFEMSGAPKSDQARVELLALCEGRITGGPGNDEDIAAALLLAAAMYVIDEGAGIGVGHTLDFERPIATNTEMSALMFTPPPASVDERRICRCTRAQALLNVMPITANELSFLRREGIGALIDRFNVNEVPAIFDLGRKCAVG